MFFFEFTRPKGTEILWEFTDAGCPNTAHGKEGLKHASTRREIQNAGQGKRGEDRLRPCTKATRVEGCIMGVFFVYFFGTAHHVEACMDTAMCSSGSWGWLFSDVYTSYCMCLCLRNPFFAATALVACGGRCTSARWGLPLMVSGSGSLPASAKVPIMVVCGRCACLYSPCCGWPASVTLKALTVLGARNATLRVVRVIRFLGVFH
jgi:hypothetical protein